MSPCLEYHRQEVEVLQVRLPNPALGSFHGEGCWGPRREDIGVEEGQDPCGDVETETHPRHSLVYLAHIVTFGGGGSQQNTDL